MYGCAGFLSQRSTTSTPASLLAVSSSIRTNEKEDSMSPGTRQIQVDDQGAHISLDWGTEELELCTIGDDGFPAPAVFELETLDELLDALHQARADVAGTRRMARMLRLPIELKNRLEAKVRREGGNQNAAIIEAIEDYLAE